MKRVQTLETTRDLKNSKLLPIKLIIVFLYFSASPFNLLWYCLTGSQQQKLCIDASIIWWPSSNQSNCKHISQLLLLDKLTLLKQTHWKTCTKTNVTQFILYLCKPAMWREKKNHKKKSKSRSYILYTNQHSRILFVWRNEWNSMTE